MLNVAVFVFFQKSLSLKIIGIHFLYERLNFAKKIGDKVCNFIFLYRSPNQSLEEFKTFADNLKLNLDTIAKNNSF